MARPATPSRAPAGVPRPPPPAWQASRPRSLSRPARCGTAAFAARPRRTRAGVGGAAGRRERPAWALEPLGATQVGLRSQKPRLWSRRRGGGPPGPTEPLARCGGARPEGTRRARQGLPSPGPGTAPARIRTPLPGEGILVGPPAPPPGHLSVGSALAPHSLSDPRALGEPRGALRRGGLPRGRGEP